METVAHTGRVGCCRECRRAYGREYYAKNLSKLRAAARLSRRKRSPEANKDDYLRWASRNPERVRELARASYARNIENCRRRLRITAALRRANILQATPLWADLRAIQEIYGQCPPGYEVDHIVPLQGRNVRGLHVSWNLQYLTASENRRKSNRL